MMDWKWNEEVRKLSHVALVIAVEAFSLFLIILNRILGWELWTIPIVIVACVTCFVMHVGRLSSERNRLVVYSIILLIELFFYSVKVETIYDSTPVIAILLVLFAMTGEKSLIYSCIAVGYFGMIFHLLSERETLTLSLAFFIRTGWHFVLVLIAGLATERLLDAWGKMDRAYRSQIDELSEENNRINTFLVNVSHEIRTPVNAVVGLSTVMLKREKDEAARRDLTSVRDAGRRVAEQVGDILDFTELDMGKLTVSSERYLLASLVNDVIAEHPANTLNECELIFEVDTTMPASMIGDPVKIKKILNHLIANAVKFSQKGGVRVRLRAPKRPYGVNLCIEVADTGIGMTKEELEHIYDSFYQSDSGRTRMAGGLGLGLTIVRGMVAEMKGFLTIESERGVGTTVCVSIPQGVADPASCTYVDNSKQLCVAGFFRFEKYAVPRVREFYSQLIANTSRQFGVSVHLAKNTEDLEELRQTYGLTHIFVGEEEFFSAMDYLEPLAAEITVVVVAQETFRPLPGSAVKILKKPFACFAVASLLSAAPEGTDVWDERGALYTQGIEALVVDDEPMNLTVAEGVFGDYGMHVTTARSGAEAIELCRARHFDLIFMDHMMPEMDGVEAMKRIRAGVGKKNQPVFIALTANAVSGAREMFLSEGFDAFVSKPIEITELERILRRVLPKSAFAAPPSAAAEAAGAESALETPEPENPDDALFSRLEQVGVQTEQGLRYCRSDPAFYRMLLDEYGRNAGKKREDMQQFYDAADWKGYTILAHTLKSTSKMIGAESLSTEAALLEAAAKKGDARTIAQHHASVLAASEAIASVIRAEMAPEESADDDEEEILEFFPDAEESGEGTT